MLLTSSCTTYLPPLSYRHPCALTKFTHRAGAAGNFVAPIAGLSSNAFKAVMDIDVLGTYNTVKATIPYLVESAARNPNPSPDGLTGGRILYVSATFHYTGMPLQAHVSAAKASVDSIMASVSLEVSNLRNFHLLYSSTCKCALLLREDLTPSQFLRFFCVFCTFGEEQLLT